MQICTDTLVRNLRLWSIITNESSLGKIGYVEVGMKHKVFLNFYKFSVTVVIMSSKIKFLGSLTLCIAIFVILFGCYEILFPEIGTVVGTEQYLLLALGILLLLVSFGFHVSATKMKLTEEIKERLDDLSKEKKEN